MRNLAVAALLAISTQWIGAPAASAQRAGAGFAHAPHIAPAHVPFSGSGIVGGHPDFSALHRFSGRAPYSDLLSYGLFSNFLDDSAAYSSGNSPNVFLIPGFPGAETNTATNGRSAQDFTQPTAEPLMIELRGDHYVRVSATNENENVASNQNSVILSEDCASQSEAQPQSKDPLSHSAGNGLIRELPSKTSPCRSTAPQTSREANAQSRIAAKSKKETSVTENAATKAAQAPNLPPAILIFRDGHRETVRDYAISAGTLYARGDYYTDGYWTKNIQLATLNMPATISSNSQQGIRFVLPSAPNEVITRP